MRVSDNHLYDLNLQALDDSRTKVSRLQQEALQQRKVLNPSDDPVGAAAGDQEGSRLKRTEGHSRAISAGVAALQVADSALSQVGDALVRLRELAIQQANETIASDQRAAASNEVGALGDTMRQLANAEHADRYVFAGYQDDEPAYDDTNTYQGDSGVRELEVAPGVRVAAGITGDVVFEGAGGGVDLFAAIESLQTALESNDIAGVRATIDQFDEATSQVSDARGILGGQQNQFDIAQSVVDRTELDATQRREDLLGVDPADSYMRLSQAQSALSSAVQIASQLPLPGLVRGG